MAAATHTFTIVLSEPSGTTVTGTFAAQAERAADLLQRTCASQIGTDQAVGSSSRITITSAAVVKS